MKSRDCLVTFGSCGYTDSFLMHCGEINMPALYERCLRMLPKDLHHDGLDWLKVYRLEKHEIFNGR